MSRQDELSELAIANVVDKLPGISDRVLDNLETEFGSVQAVADASVNELKEIDGIGPVLARKISRKTNSAKQYPTIHLDPRTVRSVVKDEQ